MKKRLDSEGEGRRMKGKRNITLGSLYSLQTQLELTYELGFVKSIDAIDTLSIEIEKMTNALINSKKDNNE